MSVWRWPASTPFFLEGIIDAPGRVLGAVEVVYSEIPYPLAVTALLVEVHADIQMVRRRQAVIVAPADIVDRNVFTRRCDEGRASGRDGHTVSAHKRPGHGEVDAGAEFVAHTGVDDVPPVELSREPLAIVDAVPEYSFSLLRGCRRSVPVVFPTTLLA